MFERDHPSFTNQPPDASTVWRYMDLARYLSLLSTSCLHFARVDQMSDKWEGALGRLNLAQRAAMYGDSPVMQDNYPLDRRAFVTNHIHLNCWHLSEYESAAMWEIYQREGRGVAVRSTWGALTASMQDDREIYGGRVEYVNYDDVAIPEGIIFDAIMRKRESFAHEHEVRLVMLTGREIPNTEDPPADSSLEPEAEAPLGEAPDFLVPVPLEPEEAGRFVPEGRVIPVSVNLNALVSEIYVAPEASSWIAEAVENVTSQYGCPFNVRHSDLDQDPIM